MARLLTRIIAGALLVGTALIVRTADAKTAGQRCQERRHEASSKYIACQQKAAGEFFGSNDQFTGSDSGFNRYEAKSGKCRTKYTALWPKFDCNIARFRDNGETITDNLTMLEWEKKNRRRHAP